MVIKDKKKFSKAVLFVLGITIGLVLLMTGRTFSHQEANHKEVSVFAGDTLWDIAAEEQKNNAYYEEKDIRDIIEDIKDINHLKSSDLSVGQVLEIPMY